MRKFYSIVSILFFFAIAAWAGPITKTDAQALAEQFFTHGKHKAPSAAGQNSKLVLAQQTDGYFAFNRGNLGGYIIVAADDAVTTPVLGYADKGEFSAENMPENMKWWLSTYEKQLKQMQANTAKPTLKLAAATATHAEVEPLLTTLWNQDSPYYDLAPVYNGDHFPQYAGRRCYIGCVATAISQVMFYHKWPQQGAGSHEYDWVTDTDSDGNPTETMGKLSSDFSSHTYDFSLMQDRYIGIETQEQRAAVAQFLYDIAVSVDMQFFPTGSGAFSPDVRHALVTYFDYDKGANLQERQYYTNAEWDAMLYAELQAERPIYYSGSGSGGGHAFVLDGYQDGYYHVNWGWGGSSNGYFLFSNLNPDNQGIGATAEAYNMNQVALFNVKPNEGGEAEGEVMFCSGGFGVKEYTEADYDQAVENMLMTKSSVAYFGRGFFNYSDDTQSVRLGVKVTDANGKETIVSKYMVNNKSQYTEADLPTNYGWRAFPISLSAFPKADGVYTVTPVYRDAKNTWHDLRVSHFRNQYLTATINGDNIMFATKGIDDDVIVEDMTCEGKVFAGRTKTIKAKIKNNGDQEYYSYLVMAVGTIENNSFSIKTKTYYNVTDVPQGESAEMLFAPEMPSAAGDYFVIVYNAYTGEILKNADGDTAVMSITVENEGEGEATFSCGQLTMPKTTDVQKEDLTFTVEVTGTNRIYDGYIGIGLIAEDTYTLTYSYQKLTVSEGETKTVTLNQNFAAHVVDGLTYRANLRFYDAQNNRIYFDTSSSKYYVYFTMADTSGMVKIDADETGKTEVYSTNGMLLLTQKGGKADLSSLPAGIYIVKRNGKSTTVVKK